MSKNNEKEFMDFRSDTVTKPTQAMRQAMFDAMVGDDVYGDDPTVNKLEEEAAKRLGKEAALFVPSGTFGNQLALFTHCQRGDEVILADDCHIVAHEAGAAAVIAGVQLRTITFPGGIPVPDEIKKRVRATGDIHEPKTALICLENALGNGRVVPLTVMKEISGIAKEYNVPIHLDGARIFNAALALGVEAREIAAYVDSVQFCLSKGLCSPVGSILAGTTAFIGNARRKRKIMGGGMRQAGVLAAPGLIALNEMTKRLGEDHETAKLLGRELAAIKGVTVEPVEINMVFFHIDGTGFPYERFAGAMFERGFLVNGESRGPLRMVTHNDVTAEDVKKAAAAIKEIVGQ
ncbi:MAG: low-specificity L-threonine aldolase [Clostridiales bacterium]|nr:low-specificity L-threonine aldolase [Clostridiales bacterium]